MHSFDQLADGFVMGILLSDFLTEREVRTYFRDFVEDMKTYTCWQELWTSPLMVIFYALQFLYLNCYFCLNHELTDEQIQITKKTCGVEINKL